MTKTNEESGYRSIPFQDRDKCVPNNKRGSRTTYQKFRCVVLVRDHYQCIICGKKQSKGLRVHHLYSWENNKDKRINPNYAVTLCACCHDAHVIDSFHYIYGLTNNTPEEFAEYYYMKTGLYFNLNKLRAD